MSTQSSRTRALPRQSGPGTRRDSAESSPRRSLLRSRFALLVPMIVLALTGPAAPVALRFPIGALAGALAAFFVLAQVRALGCPPADTD